jgi:hypothetical protein
MTPLYIQAARFELGTIPILSALAATAARPAANLVAMAERA